MDYPRPITEVHQIEISSRCNLTCHYCPSRHLDRPISEGGSGRAMQDISREHFERALEWAVYFNECGTQTELALTGLGESTMHPEFVDFLRLAREALPSNPITFSTNGLLFDEKLAQAIKRYAPQVYVSLHRPEKAGNAVDAARDAGILADVNVAAATSRFDWAGQLPVRNTAAPLVCDFLKQGWCVVLSDGRITTCCLDATGAGVVGHIDDEIGSLSVKPWSADYNGREIGCGPCWQTVP